MAWTDAHHITPWIAEFTTDLNDTLPLCETHHDFVTSKGWDPRFDHTTGAVTWTSPTGRTIVVPPPPP